MIVCLSLLDNYADILAVRSYAMEVYEYLHRPPSGNTEMSI